MLVFLLIIVIILLVLILLKMNRKDGIINHEKTIQNYKSKNNNQNLDSDIIKQSIIQSETTKYKSSSTTANKKTSLNKHLDSKSSFVVDKNINTSSNKDKAIKRNKRVQKPNFLKIYKSSVSNTKISLDKAIPVSTFINLVSDKMQKEKLMKFEEVYLWDFGITASRFLRNGDVIWLLTGTTLYELKLKFVIKDESGGIGDKIGWSRQFKSPWKNVAILEKCEKISSIPKWIVDNSYRRHAKKAKNFYKIQ